MRTSSELTSPSSSCRSTCSSSTNNSNLGDTFLLEMEPITATATSSIYERGGSFRNSTNKKRSRSIVYIYLCIGFVGGFALNQVLLLGTTMSQQRQTMSSTNDVIITDTPSLHHVMTQQQQQQQRHLQHLLKQQLSLTKSHNNMNINNEQSSSVSFATMKSPKLHNGDDNDDNDNDDDMFLPACKPFSRNKNRQIKRIYVAHMRKAGGTTIITYMQKVASYYNLTFHVTEGRTAEEPIRDDTFYVSALRDPVKRSISNYKFEYRWDCNQLVFNQSFIPTEQNSKPIYDFISRDVHNTQYPCTEGSLWTCSANCYIRWFAFPQGHCDVIQLKDPNDILHYSLKKMKRYDLILQSEKVFQDQVYVNEIETFFGLEGLWNSKEVMFCGTEAASANKKVPFIVTKQIEDIMYYRNKQDNILYDEIMSCLKSSTTTTKETTTDSTTTTKKGGIYFPSKTFSHYL